MICIIFRKLLIILTSHFTSHFTGDMIGEMTLDGWNDGIHLIHHPSIHASVPIEPKEPKELKLKDGIHPSSIHPSMDG